jgi:hypothetical protein
MEGDYGSHRAAHPPFRGDSPKPAQSPEKTAHKSLVLTILTGNSIVFNGLEQMIEGTSHSLKIT